MSTDESDRIVAAVCDCKGIPTEAMADLVSSFWIE